MAEVHKQTMSVKPTETLLERAIKRELKRIDLARTVSGSHRTAGTHPVPAEQPSFLAI